MRNHTFVERCKLAFPPTTIFGILTWNVSYFPLLSSINMKYKIKCKTNPISSPHGQIIIINQSKEIIFLGRISLAGAPTWLVTQILDIHSKFWMRGFAFCKLVLGWLKFQRTLHKKVTGQTLAPMDWLATMVAHL